ncbi:MAG: glycosyltransferase [Thermoleophilum sp.]|nr:glycosyltransferase [Thermoleophilum sp.]
MRVCVVYDCLFPLTVGGAERWYRNLAERLAREGHEVTYLTRRQWPRSRPPTVPGVRIVAVSPPGDLYTRSGRRRILPPLLFGIGVLWHLLLHGRRYDVVHTASFPYFSVLAAAVARARGRYRLVVDWHEVWSREYWHSYLGPLGAVGWAVQRLCARVDHQSFCFSRLHAERLRTIAPRTRPLVLRGEYAGPTEPRGPKPAEPVVVFAGRHIPEKRVPLLVEAFAIVARHDRELRLEILGDGPERGRVEEAVERHDLRGRVELPGFVAPQEVDQRLGRALCMVLPSMREGYGMVVVEAASRGVPSIVVRAPDNAAVELVKNGENGFVCASDDPEELARAILRVRDAGDELRERTAAWFRRNAEKLSLESSLRRVAASYARKDEPATSSACR